MNSLLLVLLAAYSLSVGNATETLRFLFVPDTEDLTARGMLDALGLGFFSIGVGLGLLITYVLVGFQARSEEAQLAEIHGEAFERWAAEVGRFLPAIGRLRRRDRSA